MSPRKAKSRREKATHHRRFLRRLTLISLLLIAAVIAYEYHHHQQAKIASTEQQTPQLRADISLTPEPKQIPSPPEISEQSEPSTKTQLDPPEREPSPPPAPKKITPAQSLRRLRTSLAAGNRDPMPVTTVQRNGTYYFLVRFPMTADQAERFAIAYGGTLPLIRNNNDLGWLSQQLGEQTKDNSTWLGATRHSNGRWQLLDASHWPLEALPLGDGPFALLSADASLSAPPPSETHPFFISWQADGSQQVTLRKALQQCGSSLTTTTPFYPRGAVVHGGNHYYIATHPSTRAEAESYAKLAGAKLATLSLEAESDFLQSALSSHPEEQSFWLGATRKGLRWHWDSGSAWSHARWSQNSPSGQNTQLLIIPKQGWVDADATHLATGFILEWSHEIPALTIDHGDHDNLNQRITERLAKVRKDYRTALKKNSDSLAWHLDTWLSGHKKSYTDRWRPAIKQLKAQVVNLRVPVDIPKSPNGSFTADMIKIARDIANKQGAIDTKFTGQAARLRDAFVEQLESEREREIAEGQLELARQLDQKILDAAELKTWIADFTSE